ncbi:hypothetical protein J2850_004252 [Azospirillum picis]|uniref:Uncharacterized protein n=1 Tax=Azospirillum picis TaxID=488438 RepID=A0ABU0MPF9_9PROT|nr:hypothetical protein [Azospirillum picis]MDQ0535363.1 hypothetical protein [Azospirillum picis]
MPRPRITLRGIARDLLETAAFGGALVVFGGFLLLALGA